MLTVVTWKWGDLFGSEYVNTTRNMFRRHLHVPHRFLCVTDDPDGLDGGVDWYPMHSHLLEKYVKLQRCARRLVMHDWDFLEDAGLSDARILQVDLDVVLVDDITPIVDCHEPTAFWQVGYAGVYSGSFQLYNAGALNRMWRDFAGDPLGTLAVAQPRGRGSDQDVLNRWLEVDKPRRVWTDADGFVVYFGKGYERFGGPGPAVLRPGARLVVLGSADKHVLDNGEYRWAREHWR